MFLEVIEVGTLVLALALLAAYMVKRESCAVRDLLRSLGGFFLMLSLAISFAHMNHPTLAWRVTNIVLIVLCVAGAVRSVSTAIKIRRWRRGRTA